MCYTWTIIGFFNKLSSLILYFTLAEIADIFAFMMAFALLESLVSSGILVLLSVILPSGWLKNGFAIKGFVVLVIAATTAILFQNSLANDYPSTLMLLASGVIPLVLTALLILLIHSRPKIQKVLVNIQDRMLIMLFIYVPIGLLSLMVVMYRNLL